MLEKANREEVKFTAPQMLELQNKRITWTWTSMTTITSTQTFIRGIKDSVRHLAAVFTLKTWYKSPGYISVFHFGPSCRCVIAQSHWQQSSLSQRCSATSVSSSRGTQRRPPGQPRVQCQGDYVQHHCRRCINHRFFSRWAPWPQFWGCWFWSLLVHTKPKGSPVDFISDIMKHQSPYITSLMQFPHLFFITFVLPGRLEL